MNKEKKQTGYFGNKNAKKTEKNDAGFSGRCLSKDKEEWTKKAKEEGLSLNLWIIKSLNNAASSN